MLLKSLKLSNIRSYNNQVIEFPEGSSLLLGDIGSGKTTVLLAVEFALFGLIKGDVSGSTLLRHGAKEGSVELLFNLEGKDVSIKRTLKRKKDTVTQDSGHIILDNRMVEATPIELKSKILELFGYPQELLNKNTSLIYRYTVYTPQEEMKTILFETKEQRLDTLRKVFNIDKYKRIRENALNYSKELRNQKRIFESKTIDLEDKKEELQMNISEKNTVSESLKKISETVLEHKKTFDTRNKELKDFELKLTELNNLRREQAVVDANLKNSKLTYDKNNKELSMIDYRIREYAAKLEELGNVELDEESIKLSLKDSEEKLTKINAAKEIIKQRLENKTADLKKIIIDDINTLNMKNVRMSKEVEKKISLETKLESLEKDHNKILLELNALTISKTQSQKIIDQLKDLSTCPTCLQKVEFTHKINITDKETINVASSERKIIELIEKHKDTEREIKNHKIELEHLRKEEIELREIKIRLQEVSQKENDRQQLIKDIDELKVKQTKLEAMDINKLVDVISKNRKILNSLEVRKHIQDSLKEKRTQQIEVKNAVTKSEEEVKLYVEKKTLIEKKILLFKDLEKEYIEKKSGIEEIASKLKEQEISASTIKKEIEILNKDIKSLEEEIHIKEQINKKIRYIEELNQWINEHFINLTSLIEKYIMAKIHQEFNELFRKWFDILMDDETLDVSIDEEFTPKIRQNDYDTEIENLSGGEKTAIALAYRLGLNKVINDFIHTIKTKDIIILDEPTDGFSEEQLDKMREVFEELDIPQLIIVSHEAKMETYVDNIIKITKNNHISKVI